MSNRLAQEKSLYLRQHADNPVNWWPWCPEAFETARTQDKPVLISIGYSACHWCHVMAHESFENDYIAGLMNQHFVCIKVDREERPDLDQIYMEAVQMLTEQGGWPLNVFCLHDGSPFFGGTYFPPEDRGYNRVPWPQLLMRISDYYQKNKASLIKNAENIVKNLSHSNAPYQTPDKALNNETLVEAASTICQTHDDTFGGFSAAPKFPPVMTLEFLLEVRQRKFCGNADTQLAERIDQVVNTTLKHMAQGGLLDQIGGGFARYSVDREWKIPHFEKMLYDNGQLIGVYTKGWLRYQKPLYRAVVEETVDWLLDEMQAPTGAFYSSLDADSEGVEGKFYVWTPEQVEAVLGSKDAQRFCTAYAITAQGNFEQGTSHLNWVGYDFNERIALAPLRAKLHAARAERVPPGKDTKIMLAWNSLLIRNLADAGFYFNRRDWFATARRAADWIWDHLRNTHNRLWAVFYSEGPSFNAYLDDYVFYTEALLAIAAKIDWLEPETSGEYIERAKRLTEVIITHFGDDNEVGFFFTADDHEKLVSRKKEWWDNAIPSGNSGLIHILHTLHTLTGDTVYASALARLRTAYSGLVRKIPNAIPYALAGLTASVSGVAVIKVKNAQSMSALQKVLAERPWRATFCMMTNDPNQTANYQLCVGTQCYAPSDDPREVIESGLQA